MTVRTRDGTWVVPPHRAVWIPAEIPHTLTMSGLVAMRTLYLKAMLAKGLPRDCCVMNVSTLLKELILHCACVEENSEMASAPGRRDPSSAGSGADDPIATSAFVRPQTGSDRRNAHEGSWRLSDAH
jgi:hypothetical protein